MQMTRVEGSGAVLEFGYDEKAAVLAVRFVKGNLVHYRGVPKSVADEFEAAPSKGKAVGQLLRGKFLTQTADPGDPANP